MKKTKKIYVTALFKPYYFLNVYDDEKRQYMSVEINERQYNALKDYLEA